MQQFGSSPAFMLALVCVVRLTCTAGIVAAFLSRVSKPTRNQQALFDAMMTTFKTGVAVIFALLTVAKMA
jgi:hypothetical protein